MTKISCACALLLLVPSLASANELARIYDLAVKNDTQLAAAEGARDASVAGNPRARGALLPQISGTGTYSEGSSTTTNTTEGSTSPTNGVAIDSDDKNTDLQVNLRQALFDAVAWNQWQAAGERAAAAQATYVIARQNLTFRVTEAYFNLLGELIPESRS